jgi:hypothetical protein
MNTPEVVTWHADQFDEMNDDENIGIYKSDSDTSNDEMGENDLRDENENTSDDEDRWLSTLVAYKPDKCAQDLYPLGLRRVAATDSDDSLFSSGASVCGDSE